MPFFYNRYLSWLIALCLLQSLPLLGISTNSLNHKGKISGTVLEFNTKQPMEYVQVALYTVSDSLLLTGTITNHQGFFEIKNLPYKEFYLQLSFIGYDTKKIDTIVLQQNTNSIDLGNLELEPSSLAIEGVEVRAKATETVYALDKKIIKVGSDLSSAGGNAVDILESQSAVQVDAEGTIKLRGNSNFSVLVDGKPTLFSAGEALQQIPATNIKYVEIITNPSAKYNPEGSAGIINVITKKNTLVGLNSLITVSGTNDGSNSTNILLDYKTKKIRYQLGINYQHFDKESERHNLTQTNSDTLLFMNKSIGKGGAISDAPSISGGMDIDLGEKSDISWGSGIGEKYSNTYKDIHYTLWYEPSLDTSRTYSIYDKSYKRQYAYLFFDYEYRFDDDGHELLFSGYFSGSERRESFTDREYLLEDTIKSQMIKDSENGNTSYSRLSVDYTWPISNKSTIEAGYLIRHSQEDEDYNYHYYTHLIYFETDSFSYSNTSDYTQENQAVYATFASSFNGLEYQLGIRGEYNTWTMNDKKDYQDFPKREDYDWFPSIHLSYRTKMGHNFSASYSKRIDRPASNYLEPFESYSSYYSKRVGNPALKPEYTDSYELNYRKSFDKSYFSFETFLRKTYNKIEKYRTYYDTVTTLYSVRNVGEDKMMGIEAAYSVDVKDWWEFTTYGQVFHYQVDSDTEADSRDFTNFNLAVKNKFYLPRDYIFQLDGVYNGGNVTTQRIVKPTYMLSASARKNFLNNKMTVSLKVRDIFNSVKMRVSSKGLDYESETKLVRYAPYVTLAVTYRINKLKKSKTPDELSEKEVNDF